MGESLLDGVGSGTPQGQQGQQQNGDGSQGSQHSGASSQPGSSQPNGSDWRQHIPEDLRNEKGWDKYKDLPSALKSLHHAEKRMGSSVAIPSEKSTPEEVSAFYEKLGVPKAHTEYKYNEPKLPEGVSWDKDGLSKFTETAHKLKLNPVQLQGVLDYYGETVSQRFHGAVEAHAKGTEALKGEWGESFDTKLSESHGALKAYDPQGEFKQLMVEIGADNDPRALRFLQRIGAETGEHTAIKGERQESMTREDAQRKVDDFQKVDKSHPLYNKRDPKHNDVVKEYREALILANS